MACTLNLPPCHSYNTIEPKLSQNRTSQTAVQTKQWPTDIMTNHTNKARYIQRLFRTTHKKRAHISNSKTPLAWRPDCPWFSCSFKKNSYIFTLNKKNIKNLSLNNKKYSHVPHIEGSWSEWCITSMIYSRDTPFWLETLDVTTTTYIQWHSINTQWTVLTTLKL